MRRFIGDVGERRIRVAGDPGRRLVAKRAVRIDHADTQKERPTIALPDERGGPIGEMFGLTPLPFDGLSILHEAMAAKVRILAICVAEPVIESGLRQMAVPAMPFAHEAGPIAVTLEELGQGGLVSQPVPRRTRRFLQPVMNAVLGRSRPVKKHARAGEQTGFGVKARVALIPSRANPSR